MLSSSSAESSPVLTRVLFACMKSDDVSHCYKKLFNRISLHMTHMCINKSEYTGSYMKGLNVFAGVGSRPDLDSHDMN